MVRVGLRNHETSSFVDLALQPGQPAFPERPSLLVGRVATNGDLMASAPAQWSVIQADTGHRFADVGRVHPRVAYMQDGTYLAPRSDGHVAVRTPDGEMTVWSLPEVRAVAVEALPAALGRIASTGDLCVHTVDPDELVTIYRNLALRLACRP